MCESDDDDFECDSEDEEDGLRAAIGQGTAKTAKPARKVWIRAPIHAARLPLPPTHCVCACVSE
jgi:hypothetical protein